jgi:hypothetical protein
MSAQVGTPAADLPTNQQVLAFLTESIDWYRHCAIERQVASDPADLVFVEDNRPRAAEIVQLSFDFARADAQFFGVDRSHGIALLAQTLVGFGSCSIDLLVPNNEQGRI